MFIIMSHFTPQCGVLSLTLILYEVLIELPRQQRVYTVLVVYYHKCNSFSFLSQGNLTLFPHIVHGGFLLFIALTFMHIQVQHFVYKCMFMICMYMCVLCFVCDMVVPAPSVCQARHSQQSAHRPNTDMSNTKPIKAKH